MPTFLALVTVCFAPVGVVIYFFSSGLVDQPTDIPSILVFVMLLATAKIGVVSGCYVLRDRLDKFWPKL